MSTLRRSQVGKSWHWQILKWIDEKPIATVTRLRTSVSPDQVCVNYRTAEVLERNDLVSIAREIDGDGLIASDLSLTQSGKEALQREGRG